MGKSAKAKKEKKKDFQKAKLKVGKTKPKASNATDTSFKARCKTSNSQASCWSSRLILMYSNIRTAAISNNERTLHIHPICPPPQPPKP
jgi:hypothetical protein